MNTLERLRSHSTKIRPPRSGAPLPGTAYRARVVQAVLSLAMFSVVYLLLVALVFAVAFGMGWAGYHLLGKSPGIYTFVFAFGLGWTGVMISVFMVRFLFVKPSRDTDLVEITSLDQPEFISFVREVALRADAPNPRHVFIGPGCNAAAFFNPTFWSLLLPVRRSLSIGVGLVNALSVGELKAVLGHEFGHFSHSSRFESYAYTANRVFYSTLFENTSFAEEIARWASMHWVFSICGKLTIVIVRGVRWILEQVYIVVHGSMMALSREIEFKADSVGASVGGSEQLISALGRIQLGERCLTMLENTYTAWSGENLRPENAYAQHRALMLRAVQPGEDPREGNDANAREEPACITPLPRVRIADQWASHPTMEDRTLRLKQIGVIVEAAPASAWTLFTDVEAIQQKMTDIMFPNRRTSPATVLSTEVLLERLDAHVQFVELPGIFKGYYAQHWPEVVDPDASPAQSLQGSSSVFDEILTPDAAARPARLGALYVDLANLQAVVDKQIKVRYFEFEGVQYQQSDAAALLDRLKEEAQRIQDEMKHTDRALFSFFQDRACKAGKGEEFMTEVRSLYKSQEQYDRVCKLMIQTATYAGQLSDLLLWKQEELQKVIRLLSLEDLGAHVSSGSRVILEEYLKEPPIVLSRVKKPFEMDETSNLNGECICVRCGTALRMGMTVCPSCGYRFEFEAETLGAQKGDIQPEQSRTAGAESAESEKYECPYCGKAVSSSTSTCPSCQKSLDAGEDLRMPDSLVIVDDPAAAQEEDVPQCPYCGKKIRWGKNKCIWCGRVLYWGSGVAEGDEFEYHCTYCTSEVPQGRLCCPRCGTSRIDLEKLRRVRSAIMEVNELEFHRAFKRYCEYEASLFTVRKGDGCSQAD